MAKRHRLLLTFLVPLILILVGALGFQWLEGVPFFDSLYWSVITLTTLGYGDFFPHTDAGKVFTMILVLSGVFTMFYAATAIIRLVVSGELADLVGQGKMERVIAHLRDHVIVCGFGRMGRLVCQEFSREEVPFVLIEENADKIREFHVPHGAALAGDATSDEALKKAGIDRARALVTVMDSDANNLFCTLSARLLNPRLHIVARVENVQNEEKLVRAGANRVISPYQIGGARVAQAVLRPTVQDFIELATRTEHIELQLEETRIAPGSSLVGKSLVDSHVRDDLRIIIVAIKKPGGKMVFNPPAAATLEEGDTLVALGHRDQLEKLDSLAQPGQPRRQ